MTNRLMVSVAAIALIAGVGYANAQGAGGAGHESGGAAMHNSAGGGASAGGAGGATMNRDSAAPSQGSGTSDMKQSQSEQKSGAMKNERAEEGQKSKGMTSEREGKGGKDMKAEGREDRNNMKAEGRQDRTGNQNAESREGRSNNMNAETKTNERSQTTTGQAGAGAKLSTEQRTKITSVIRNEHVSSVSNVNFNVSVGTRVPRDVQFHPLPADVVTIYPEWRGYNFILVRDEIVIIDPNTYEIVAVLNA